MNNCNCFKICCLLLGIFFCTPVCCQNKTFSDPPVVRICWDAERQPIDGFGAAQAGWADRLYAHRKRSEVMEWLFGTEGLKLSILRGEVFPHYGQTEETTDFGIDATIDLALTDTFFDTMTPDLSRRGQLWITRQARDTYHVDKLLFSTWTPPAYMKSNANVSKGSLKEEYYQRFADYLVDFCKAYASAGLEVYAISPSNEPGYEAEWNSCKWSAVDMGRFLTKNLGPAMKRSGLKTKIVLGENCLWSTPRLPMLSTLSSQKFVEDVIDAYPEIGQVVGIASGHGYTIPAAYTLGKEEEVATPIVPYTQAEKQGMKVWVTEISTVDPLDASMENGLMWATVIHRYLTQAHVNAFVWWGGAIPASNNESLIVLDADRDQYSLTKRFETLGNFSRYIPVGSKRVEVEVDSALGDSILISSYKYGRQYTIVAINDTDQAIPVCLQLKGAMPENMLTLYLTDQTRRWEKQTPVVADQDRYFVTLAPKSVVSCIGTVRAESY